MRHVGEYTEVIGILQQTLSISVDAYESPGLDGLSNCERISASTEVKHDGISAGRSASNVEIDLVAGPVSGEPSLVPRQNPSIRRQGH